VPATKEPAPLILMSQTGNGNLHSYSSCLDRCSRLRFEVRPFPRTCFYAASDPVRLNLACVQSSNAGPPESAPVRTAFPDRQWSGSSSRP
jgi:hypothetical protein